jgi:hypothetical protein
MQKVTISVQRELLRLSVSIITVKAKRPILYPQNGAPQQA